MSYESEAEVLRYYCQLGVCTGWQRTLQEMAAHLDEPYFLFCLFSDCCNSAFPGWPERDALACCASAVEALCSDTRPLGMPPEWLVSRVNHTLRWAERQIDEGLPEGERAAAKDGLRRACCKLIREILQPPPEEQPEEWRAAPLIEKKREEWPVPTPLLRRALIWLRDTPSGRLTAGELATELQRATDYDAPLSAWEQVVARLLSNDHVAVWWESGLDGKMHVDLNAIDTILADLPRAVLAVPVGPFDVPVVPATSNSPDGMTVDGIKEVSERRPADRAPWPWPVQREPLLAALRQLATRIEKDTMLPGGRDNFAMALWCADESDQTTREQWNAAADVLVDLGVARPQEPPGSGVAIDGELLKRVLADPVGEFEADAPAPSEPITSTPAANQRHWSWAVPRECLCGGLHALRARHVDDNDPLALEDVDAIAQWFYWHDRTAASTKNQRAWPDAVRQLFACGVLSWICCPVLDAHPKGNKLVVDVSRLDEVLAGAGPVKVQHQWSTDGLYWVDGDNENAEHRRVVVTDYSPVVRVRAA